MAERILARGAISKRFHIARVIMFLGAVSGAGVYYVGNRPVGILMIVGFGALSLWLEIWSAIQRSRQIWVEVQPDGFVIQDRRGEQSFRDSQVTSISYTTKKLYGNGVYSGFNRTGKLWVGDQSQPFIFYSSFNTKQTDPLAGLLQRIYDLLAAGFTQALDHGLALEGNGWKLTKTDLTYRNGSKEETLRVADIAASEYHDGKTVFWRIGEDMPCAQFPLEDQNVGILGRVISEILARKPAAELPATGMGRVLFQRGAAKVLTVILALFAIGPMLAAVAVLVNTRTQPEWAALALCIAGSALFWFFTFAYGMQKFRCHERGVFKSGLFGKNQMMYKEVRSFTYSAIRQYHNGAYIGTHLKFRFDPLPGTPNAKVLTFNTSVSGADAELDKLRDTVSIIIAQRMMKDLAAGSTVPWTNNISFTPDGFEYRPNALIGRKEAVTMPIANYGGNNVKAGTFYLFEKGNTKAVMSEPASSPNFYPGWFLLQMLYHRQS